MHSIVHSAAFLAVQDALFTYELGEYLMGGSLFLAVGSLIRVVTTRDPVQLRRRVSECALSFTLSGLIFSGRAVLPALFGIGAYRESPESLRGQEPGIGVTRRRTYS